MIRGPRWMCKSLKTLALWTLAIGLVSSCASSPSTPATSNAASSVLDSVSGSGTTTETASDDSDAAQPLARPKAAMRALSAASTIEYTIESASVAGAEGIRLRRDVTVDAVQQRASTRLRLRSDVSGKPKIDGTLMMVSTADTIFLTSPGWTGARRNKWMLLTEASAAEMGVPLGLSAPTSTPLGIDGLQLGRTVDKQTFEGTVEAEPGLNLLGLGAALKDPELRRSLTGTFRAWVKLDPDSQQIVELRIAGMGNTVSFTSDPALRKTMEQSLSITTAIVTIKQIGEPVTITLPAQKDVIEP